MMLTLKHSTSHSRGLVFNPSRNWSQSFFISDWKFYARKRNYCYISIGVERLAATPVQHWLWDMGGAYQKRDGKSDELYFCDFVISQSVLHRPTQQKQSISNMRYTSQTSSHLPPTNRLWVGCQPSKPTLRRYPCSLWTLFHTMTVAAYNAKIPGSAKLLIKT